MASGWLEDAGAAQLVWDEFRARVPYMIKSHVGSGKMAMVGGEEGRRVSGHGGGSCKTR